MCTNTFISIISHPFSSNENNYCYYECFIGFSIYTSSIHTDIFSNKSCNTFIYNESSLSINE